MNYFRLSFALIILEVRLKIYLKLKYLIFPSFTSFSSHSGGIGRKSVDFSSVFVVSDDSSLSLFLVVSSDS